MHNEVDTVKVRECIICTKSGRGKGNNLLSPVRRITEVFDFDGTLIAEMDNMSITPESLMDFINYRFKDEERERIIEWAAEYFIENRD